MTPPKNKCTAITAKGTPCKAWSIHDSNPPRCAPHSGITGAPKGNSNALTHGFYQRHFKPAELNALFDTAADVSLIQEAVLLRVLLRRLSGYLLDPEIPLNKVTSIGPLIISGARALAYVEKQLPDPNAIDWDATLDRLAEELDWDI
jgi:hypothetical protein